MTPHFYRICIRIREQAGTVLPIADPSLSEITLLDATTPMIQPRDLPKRLPELVRGGVHAVLATAAAIEDFRSSMQVVGAWLEIERSRSHRFRIARSVADIVNAKATGDIAVILHFQGADPIEDRLDYLNVFQASGLRVMQVTYNARNRLGDGCFEPTDAGLSKFGRKVVARMEELRVAVDLAHAGTRTAIETAAIATRPVVVTHANARALFDTPRNVTDEVIRVVASTGGVIGACAVPFFLARDRPATLDMLIDHVAHIADLVGAAHVGLGFDFAQEDEDDYVYFGYDERYVPKPPWIFPTDIASHSDAGNIAPALRARGFAESEVRGILGANFLRVFKQVWGD